MSKHKLIAQTIKQCIFFISFFIVLMVVLSNRVSAQTTRQESLTISPIIQDIKLTPGIPYTYNMKLTNRGNQPIGIHINTGEFDPDHLSGPVHSITSLGAWTKLSENDFIIDEKQTKQIFVTITTPRNARNGGYYETLFITPFITGQQIANTPVVLTRFIAFVFGTVGNVNYNNLKEKVKIESFSIPSSATSKILRSKFLLLNSYFTHLTAKPFLSISPLFGRTQTVILSEKHIFPGRTRAWNEEIQNVSPNHIFYWADLSVSVGGGKQIQAHTFFVIIPLSIQIVSITIILVALGLLLRKRIKKAVIALLR